MIMESSVAYHIFPRERILILKNEKFRLVFDVIRMMKLASEELSVLVVFSR